MAAFEPARAALYGLSINENSGVYNRGDELGIEKNVWSK